MSEDKTKKHKFDDDAVCIHCGFDGAEQSWVERNLRLEIGDDEFEYRREHGDFDVPCRK